MIARLNSFTTIGIDAVACEVQVDVAGRGFGSVAVVGIGMMNKNWGNM